MMHKAITSEIFNRAVKKGDLNNVIDLCRRGYNIENDKYSCTIAANRNHLHVLKWLHNNGFHWNKETLYAAVLKGHFEIIEYLYKEGCPYDIEQLYIHAVSQPSEDRVDILEYLNNNNYPLPNTEIITENNGTNERAIYQVHIPDEMRCTAECGCQLKFIQSPCNVAASNGNLNSLEWFLKHGFKCSDDIYIAACRFDEFNIVKYLHEHGYPWNSDLCAIAAAFGRIKILQYAVENGCHLDNRTENSAKCHRQLKIMNYLSQQSTKNNI